MSGTEKGRYGQYLIFQLDSENFAVSVSRVKEILGQTHITKIPGIPDFIKGVINLRGNVVPVLDLGINVGMTSAVASEATYIIITEVVLEDETLLVGAQVDAVSDVLGISDEMINPVPPLASNVNQAVVSGIGKVDEALYTILDIDKILALNETMLHRHADGTFASDIGNPTPEINLSR
jgi:purine-binding chemotaxis protein CheW